MVALFNWLCFTRSCLYARRVKDSNLRGYLIHPILQQRICFNLTHTTLQILNMQSHLLWTLSTSIYNFEKEFNLYYPQLTTKNHCIYFYLEYGKKDLNLQNRLLMREVLYRLAIPVNGLFCFSLNSYLKVNYLLFLRLSSVLKLSINKIQKYSLPNRIFNLIAVCIFKWEGVDSNHCDSITSSRFTVGPIRPLWHLPKIASCEYFQRLKLLLTDFIVLHYYLHLLKFATFN